MISNDGGSPGGGIPMRVYLAPKCELAMIESRRTLPIPKKRNWVLFYQALSFWVSNPIKITNILVSSFHQHSAFPVYVVTTKTISSYSWEFKLSTGTFFMGLEHFWVRKVSFLEAMAMSPVKMSSLAKWLTLQNGACTWRAKRRLAAIHTGVHVVPKSEIQCSVYQKSGLPHQNREHVYSMIYIHITPFSVLMIPAILVPSYSSSSDLYIDATYKKLDGVLVVLSYLFSRSRNNSA